MEEPLINDFCKTLLVVSLFIRSDWTGLFVMRSRT